MISLKSASERERERVMYSKRMIKLVRCGYSRQLSSTCFLLFLSVLLWLFFCNDVTAFCSLFFHLSRLISLLFASGLKIGHGGLFFHFFTFCGVGCFCFWFRWGEIKKKPNFSFETSSQSRRTLTRSRARLITNTLFSAYIFVICKIRNRRSTKTHTQAKRVCLFFLFVTKE